MDSTLVGLIHQKHIFKKLLFGDLNWGSVASQLSPKGNKKALFYWFCMNAFLESFASCTGHFVTGGVTLKLVIKLGCFVIFHKHIEEIELGMPKIFVWSRLEQHLNSWAKICLETNFGVN